LTIFALEILPLQAAHQPALAKQESVHLSVLDKGGQADLLRHQFDFPFNLNRSASCLKKSCDGQMALSEAVPRRPGAIHGWPF